MTISDCTSNNVSTIFKGVSQDSEFQNNNARGGMTITKEKSSQSMLKTKKNALQNIKNNELNEKYQIFSTHLNIRRLNIPTGNGKD